MMRNYKSIITALLVTIIYGYSAYIYKPYKVIYYQAGGDAFGYYIYLPSIFIHHDLSNLKSSLLAKYKHCDPGKIINNTTPNLEAEAPSASNGNPVIKYSIGVAILQIPFFLIAHFLAGLVHEPPDGFSMIYMYAIQISVIFYGMLGFLALILILRRSFSDIVIAMVIVTIGLATNLYYLVTVNAPMSHPYLFFIYAVLIYATIYYYDTFRLRFLLLIGFCCGIITLIRFNEVYAVLIPLLWGIRNRADVKDRIQLIRSNLLPFMYAGLMFIICIIPQLVYWKSVSGHYLYYSYGKESFDFRHPHIIDGLFSFGNGWLAYTPVMYLALIGIYFTARKRHPSFMSLAVFLPLHIYIIYSWWCWFYMGSYGSRPMTEVYPLLSIPLAYTIEWFWSSRFKRLLIIFMILFFSWLLLFQTYQSNLNIFNSVVGNWRFIVASFGKTKLTYDEAVVVDTREFQPRNPFFVKHLCDNDFEDSTLIGSTRKISLSGTRSVCVKAEQFQDGCKLSLGDASGHPGQWVKASVNCYSLVPPFNLWEPSQLVIEFLIKGHTHKWRSVRLQNKVDNPDHGIWSFQTGKWGNAHFYSQVPDMKSDDTIKVFIWNGNPNGPDIYVDDLKVELYEEK